MNRKQRREQERQRKKMKNKPEVEQKMMMFDQLPDECLSCLKPFDKKDKSMVMSWSVVVREKEKVVRLYCPDCWQKAIDVVEALKNEDND
jgi:ribosomal protein L44E